MTREDCYPMFLDRRAFDVIVREFGEAAAEKMTPEDVDEIRVEAVKLFSGFIAENGKGPYDKALFDDSIIYAYQLRYIF